MRLEECIWWHLSIQWAYGCLMAALLHPTYLPFTVDQLRGHFAPVPGTGELDRHLTYYLASLEQRRRMPTSFAAG
jgi:hypothetical protein